MTEGTPVVAALLAAGAGSRFAGPTHKLDADLRGRTVLRRAVDAARDSGIGPVVVVTAEHVATDLASLADVHVVRNDDWASGQQSSLRRAIEAAAALGALQVVVGLGDQPFLSPSAWRAVAAAGSTAPIAVATYAEAAGADPAGSGPPGRARRGHPVSLAATVWPLLPTSGDEGARRLMALRPDLVTEVPCEGSTVDIDTMEDLHRWQNSSSTSSP